MGLGKMKSAVHMGMLLCLHCSSEKVPYDLNMQGNTRRRELILAPPDAPLLSPWTCTSRHRSEETHWQLKVLGKCKEIYFRLSLPSRPINVGTPREWREGRSRAERGWGEDEHVGKVWGAVWIQPFSQILSPFPELCGPNLGTWIGARDFPSVDPSSPIGAAWGLPQGKRTDIPLPCGKLQLPPTPCRPACSNAG